jgi:hypothetical protein
MWALLAICLAGCAATLGDPAGDPAGEGEGSGQSEAGSCKQVDVLFAVDNSGSTQKEQQALRDGFADFASELLHVGDDYRVGLVDGCPQPPMLHTRGMEGPCNFAGGQPWIESSSPYAVDEFRCVANIDSRDAQCNGNNDDEQPVTTAASALDPAWAAAGRPNAGFARGDALLVVIAMTDEDEHSVPPATAQTLHDQLVADKGDAGKLVFIGVGGKSDCDGPYGDANDANTLQAIAAQFGDHGGFWDLCQGKLDEGLRAAVDVIESACD